MRWLIRRVLKKSASSLSYEDDIHFGEVLTIGRAADQAIFLPDLRAALNHASITAVGKNKYKVESLIVAGIRVNGEITYSITVGHGAVVELGSTRLTLVDLQGDFDAAVEVSTIDKSEQAAIVSKRKKPTSLSQTWISKRWPSWLGFFLVLGFGLLVPAATHIVPGLNKILRYSPLPSTTFWNPGEIDSAHRFFANDCTRCHKNAFLMVRDNACTSCHTSTKAHADPVKFNIPALGDARCGSCHQDHNGDRGMISKDQRLCADCHADLKTRTKGASVVADVSDFGSSHPQFHVNLPGWSADNTFTPKSMLWSSALKENSGLKFNHLKHLDPKGLNTPDGRKNLECSNCHQPDAGGSAMKPIAFETMCHECHKLGFDTLAPDREVPHADVAAVSYTLNEFYANRGLEGGYADARAPTVVQERRRPGSPPLSREERVEALAWARDRSEQAAKTVFTGKACVTCHSVNAPSAANNVWQIAPVRVSGIWYSKAKFNHAKHQTSTCLDCHGGAPKSEASNDLLIPGIENCRECHAGAHAKDKVASTCIACHGYHTSPLVTLDKKTRKSP